jgi:type IX secretion system PorP/SprF family membrane protein
MFLNRPLLCLLCVLFFTTLKAQDIHFTQFGYVPLAVNPAQTGLFEGTYRVGGLYRSQWQSSNIKGYQTPVVYADVPIAGLRKQDWIGIGLNLYRDRAGISLLTNTDVGINVAYHLGMDKKQTTVLSFGVQAGFVQRNIDKSKLIFRDGLITGQSQDIPLIDAQNKNYTDIGFGVNLRSKASKTTTYNVGLSVEHILSPKYNLITSTIAKLPPRINLYGGLNVDLNKKMSLSPALIVRAQSGNTEIMLQALAGMKLDPKKDITVKGGLGYRVGDAAQILLGMDYGDIRVGGAFDYTLSQVRNANSQNGFEIAVGYIGKIFKSVKPNKVILCPRY